MFNRFLYRILVLALLSLGALTPAKAQEFVLRTSVFSAGGQRSTAGNLVLQSTVGQPGLGRATEGEFLLQGGFWPQVTGAAGPLAVPAALDDAATTDEDTAVEIDVLANDSDPAGETVRIDSHQPGDHGFVTLTEAMTLVYTPEADFNGQDAFTYRIINDRGGLAEATVTVTVNPVNDAPVFTSTPLAAVVVDAEYRYVAKAADVENDALTFTAPVLPSWLALVEQTDSTATLVGTPTAAEAGEHAVTLAASDGADAVEQTFTLTVTAIVPAAPVLLAPEDGAVVDPSGGVPLAWQAVLGAASYGLDLATVADFSAFESRIIGIPDTTWILHGLQDNTLYFWRVRAANSLGVSDYSAPRSFSTGMNVATEDEAGVPAAFALRQNYPNPFNPATTIAYGLPRPAEVRLVVYDLFGRAVTTLVETRQAAGRYTVSFDAEGLASGTYFYRIEANAWSRTRQMILLK